MKKFSFILCSLINETKEAKEIITPIIEKPLKEIDKILNFSELIKNIGEGQDRTVYLIKSRNTVLKVAFEKEGISQNELEVKDHKKYNLVTPKIIQIFKNDKNQIIAIECEYISKIFKAKRHLVGNENKEYLEYLKMSEAVWFKIMNMIKKQEEINSDKFFNLIEEYKKSKDPIIIQDQWILNYSKSQFNKFLNSKWFKQLIKLILEKKVKLGEFRTTNLGITKGRVVIVDTGR